MSGTRIAGEVNGVPRSNMTQKRGIMSLAKSTH